MRFWLGDVEVLFPYSFIYPEQYEYMRRLKDALDKGGTAVLEMPTGTGKTISLLALITSYQAAKGQSRKLVYCSRTVTEIEKVVEEVKRLLAYRIEELGPSGGDYLCLALSSRKNLCIHPEVAARPPPGCTESVSVNENQKTGSQVDSQCRDMTSTWAREDPNVSVCSWFEGFENEGRDAFLKDVYSLEDLRVLGVEKGWCPYFLARHLASSANLVVFSYQYILDPKIAKLVCSQFDENTIVVFDEAHNIDTVCLDALSINVTQSVLDGSTKNLTTISASLETMKENNSERLKDEYERLVNGLELPAYITEKLSAPVLGANGIFEKVTQTVPGNLRKAEHFVQYLRRLLKYLKEKLRKNNVTNMIWVKQFTIKLMQEAQVNLRSLQFSSARLQSLLYTLQLKEISQFSSISILCDFAALLGTYERGFCLLVENSTPTSEAAIKFCCLDASIAMKPVLSQFRSVVITSGTLSPLDMFPQILNFVPVVSARFQMSLHRPCLCPLIVTKGGDQVAVTSKYEARKDPAVVRNYGNLVVDMASVVPDGMVCFFPSYHYMESIVTLWNDMGILGQLLNHKLLFIETSNPTETTLALSNFRKAASSGRGAVLFSVARGKISEGIDFDHHYGRCVIVFGIPFVYTENRVLKERLKYLRDQYGVREGDFLTFDAMRTTAQCVGRIIRGKSDYGIMVFADKRYNRADKRNKLPQWISQHLTSTQLNLSTDMAVGVASNFLREMAQPTNKNDELGKSLWTLQHVLQYQAQLEANK